MFIETESGILLNLFDVLKIFVQNLSEITFNKIDLRYEPGKIKYRLIAKYQSGQSITILSGTKNECRAAELNLKKKLRLYSSLISYDELYNK
jgi:hypothetical protein